MKFIVFLGIILLLFGCENSDIKESPIIDKDLVKKDSCEDLTWRKLGRPRFELEKHKKKFRAKNLKLFKLCKTDSCQNQLEPLNKEDYYTCFQNITLNCPRNGHIPPSKKIARFDDEGRNAFYYYSIQPTFESFDESIHSFTTYLYKEHNKKISILGLYHYLGRKEILKDPIAWAIASPIGGISSTFKNCFTLAKYEEKDSVIIHLESELIEPIDSKRQGAPYLIKRTEVSKYDSGKIDSLIEIVEYVTWDLGVLSDYAEYENGKLITDFENPKFRTPKR